MNHEMRGMERGTLRSKSPLVTRCKWLSGPAYADLVALCRFLLGSACGQVGFVLGLTRAGTAALLAFILSVGMFPTGSGPDGRQMESRWAEHLGETENR